MKVTVQLTQEGDPPAGFGESTTVGSSFCREIVRLPFPST